MKKTHSLTRRSFHPGSQQRAMTAQNAFARTDRYVTTDSKTDR